MEKIWLKSYPEGMPEEAPVAAHASLVALFEASRDAFRERPAFTSGTATLTYADVDRLSQALAQWLVQQGLAAGSRVGIMLPNLLQYPVSVLGVLRAGMVVVNINPLYTPRELGNVLRDSGCEVLIALDAALPLLEEAGGAPALRHVIATHPADLVSNAADAVAFGKAGGHDTTGFKAALASAETLDHPLPRPVASDLAFLQYTGGTTGIPKGAMLTHGNVVANVEQNSVWQAHNIQAGHEVVVTALPLYHIFALTVNFLLFMKHGANNLLIANPRDMPGFVNALKAQRWTAITGVNTLYNGLLHTPGFATLDFSQLKIALSGGTATQKAVAEKWQQVTGHPISEGYGLSETSPTVSSNHSSMGFTGTIGLPLPSTLVQIRGDNDQVLAPGEVGEICVKGPQVSQGYWQRPDETALAFSSDGWFRTGDVGVMNPSGTITITDRKKDMILVSGFNVYPNEVEGVIAEHAGVFECAVIGVSDEATGEAVKAVVVRRDPELTVEDVRLHCRKSLTAYKVPKHVEFRDALPKTPVGKILRRALRDQA
jgi:long-chain acyl-CoA synthetase